MVSPTARFTMVLALTPLLDGPSALPYDVESVELER